MNTRSEDRAVNEITWREPADALSPGQLNERAQDNRLLAEAVKAAEAMAKDSQSKGNGK